MATQYQICFPALIRGVKTSLGKEFNKNSLHRLLRNKRYIGYYIYKDTETPGGMPRILDDDLFERVQSMLDRNKKAPARKRGKDEYLLTTKLFCGYCKEMMIGYGGTGKSGKAYYYYACKNAKKKLCKKKIVDKQTIEERVITACLSLLTESNIKKIAKAVADICKADMDSTPIKRLKDTIREIDMAIENLWKALEHGQSVDMITERIDKRKQEKATLEDQLALEMAKEFILTEPQVVAFLQKLKSSKDDIRRRRSIINIFVSAIYLWDDKFRMVLNGSDKQIVIDDILLDDINEHFDNLNQAKSECSHLVAGAPPNGASFVSLCSDFLFYKTECTNAAAPPLLQKSNVVPGRSHKHTLHESL